MTGPMWTPPTPEQVLALVKEFTERLDKMGLAGAIVVRHVLENDAGRIDVRGASERWTAATRGQR